MTHLTQQALGTSEERLKLTFLCHPGDKSDRMKEFFNRLSSLQSPSGDRVCGPNSLKDRTTRHKAAVQAVFFRKGGFVYAVDL